MTTGKLTVLLTYAFVGWALCAVIMSIGITTMSPTGALILHALAAPILFVLVARLYFRRFAYTTPLQTAFAFVSVVILVDFFLVALLVNHSLGIFASPLGTWIPFLLIFTATHLTGLIVSNNPRYGVRVR
jgi:hypothetical protein